MRVLVTPHRSPVRISGVQRHMWEAVSSVSTSAHRNRIAREQNECPPPFHGKDDGNRWSCDHLDVGSCVHTEAVAKQENLRQFQLPLTFRVAFLTSVSALRESRQRGLARCSVAALARIQHRSVLQTSIAMEGFLNARCIRTTLHPHEKGVPHGPKCTSSESNNAVEIQWSLSSRPHTLRMRWRDD